MPPKSKANAKATAKAKVGEKRLTKAGSKIHALDAGGHVFKAFYVWSMDAPVVRKDPDQIYGKCIVLPGSNETVFKLKQVEPEEVEEVFESPATRCYNSNAGIDPMEFSDIGMIPHTNEACVLDYMRSRLMLGNIFVTAEPLLVVQNPFKNVGNATDEWINKYRDCPDDPAAVYGPHVFSIARTALENLHAVNKSQTIIVSGESGAGKTEATKQAMRFFAAARSGGAIDLRVQKAILAANPVLEAFGNAKTIRNNNSSRFGRYMQLLVAKTGGITNGSVQGFLLEKSRILQQVENERSYHIFYQILKGASAEQKSRFKLLGLSQYAYINPKCLDSPGIDDLAEWRDVQSAFDSMMVTNDERDAILSICSGVLLMGNVKVRGVAKQGVDNAAELAPESRADFETACRLMFIDPARVEEGICIKISIAGGSEIRGYWNQAEGEMLKASLAKAMYDSTFQYIIKKLNSNIEPPTWPAYMGMLDIFGFEVFKANSLEQLFINVTNEMLQKNFTDTVFDKESKLYKEEGIPITDLIFTSNAEVISALSGKRGSLFAILEDQCLAPGGTDEKFLSAVYTTLKDSTKIFPAKVGGQQNFVVAHTIGDINYVVDGFLFKNKDVLRAELIEVIQASTNPVTADLYAGVVVEKGKSAKGQLIGSQFMNQLTRLMELINATEAHFIRCVKPNEEKLPLTFTPSKVLIQLQSLSILEALQLRNLGYSYRRPFKDFLYQYKFVNLGISEDTTLEPSDAARKLLQSAKIPDSDWKIGKTMTFMKPEAMKLMQHKQREALAAWQPLITVIEAMYKRLTLKKEYTKRRSGIIRTQALARRRLAGRVQNPTVMETF